MKKIISFLLAAMMIMSVQVSFAESEDTQESNEAKTIVGLGIMQTDSDGNFAGENTITRREMAKIIADIYNYGTENDEVAKWKDEFFKDFNVETSLILPQEGDDEAEIFADVSASDEAYDAIKLVSQKGIMVGVGDNEFNPDGNITVEQLIKTVVSILGYAPEAAQNGGYPNGYTLSAENLGLTKGVGNYKAYATRNDAAKILYNALDVELMQLKVKNAGEPSFETIEGETFLTKILNLKKIKGRMTDNGYTTFLGESVVGEENVKIASYTFKLTEQSENIREFIGRDTECYYNDDDEIIYGRLTEKDETVKFTAADFESFKDGKIEYFLNDKKKNISVSKNAALIKNGMAKPSFDESIFDFYYGDITLITPKGENCADLIIIKEYVNFNIDNIDLQNSKLYSEDSRRGKELDIDDADKKVTIYDASGNVIDSKMLTKGMITNIVEGDKLLEIYISGKVTEKAKVTSIAYDDGETTLITDKGEFNISKDFLAANTGSLLPQTGGVYTLWCDMFGVVVKYQRAATEGNFGVIINAKAIDDEGTAQLMLNMYDLTTGTFEKSFITDTLNLVYEKSGLTVRKKFNIEKNLNDVYEIVRESIYDKNERIGALCRYNTDDEGNLTLVELAGKQKKDSHNEEDRLVELGVDTSSYNGNKYCSGYIGGQAIISDKTKVVAYNYESEEFDSGKGFVIGTRSLFTDNEVLRKVRAYTVKADSPVADYVLYTKDVSKGITTSPQTVGIVRKVYESLDDEDQTIKIIRINADGTEYKVADDALEAGKVTNMQDESGWTDGNGKFHNYTVEKGDIIRYSVDSSGNIDKVMLVFDANADYSGGITIAGKVYYPKTACIGALAGCIDYWDDALYKYSNPYSASYQSSTGKNQFSPNAFAWMLYSDEDMRVILGSPVRTGDGYLITTTQNLQNGTKYDTVSDVYMTNTWSAKSCTLVEFGGKNITISTMPVTSIKTYENAGSACDRVFLTSRCGDPRNIIVLRGEIN